MQAFCFADTVCQESRQGIEDCFFPLNTAFGAIGLGFLRKIAIFLTT
jgi:hypothetical protein